MNALCEKDKDIIIVGSQAGTLTYDFGYIEQYMVSQFLFLMGTQPDAVLLCVNPFDDFDYISRTISFIKSSVDCEILALVMFPMDIKDDWGGVFGQKTLLPEEKYAILKNQWQTALGIPVFKLGDSADMEKITAAVIDFFTDSPAGVEKSSGDTGL